MHDDDYDNDYLDAIRYMMGGINDAIDDYDPDEEYRMIGIGKQVMDALVEQELERQELLKKIGDSMFPYVGVDFARMEPEARSCSHEWKTYNGFTETFEFCQKCDVKK